MLAHLRASRFRLGAGFVVLAARTLALLGGCTRKPSTNTSSRRSAVACQPGWSCT